MGSLKARLEQKYAGNEEGIKVHMPWNTETLDLTFRGDRIAKVGGIGLSRFLLMVCRQLAYWLRKNRSPIPHYKVYSYPRTTHTRYLTHGISESLPVCPQVSWCKPNAWPLMSDWNSFDGILRACLEVWRMALTRIACERSGLVGLMDVSYRG
jgi:hypothetical protein